MDQSGCLSLQPIIESSDGEHVSIYVSNTGNILELKKKVRESIRIARGFIGSSLEKEQIDTLLAPIERLGQSGHLLGRFNGSLVIFRAKNFLRILNIPAEMNDLCVVASSFHVKPLLRWSQKNRDFILLGLEKNMAHLYRSSMGKVQHIDSILFPETLRSFFGNEEYGYRKGASIQSELLVETWDWINSWLEEIPTDQRPQLYVAGDRNLSEGLISRIRYHNKHPSPISQFFKTTLLHGVVAKIRATQQIEAENALDNTIRNFAKAEAKSQAHSNLSEISKSALNGQVRKLVISEDTNIFGKICPETGRLTIHAMNLDHEDDDILDDLAQQVLKNGGQVVVVPDGKIPNQIPAIAILKK